MTVTCTFVHRVLGDAGSCTRYFAKARSNNRRNTGYVQRNTACELQNLTPSFVCAGQSNESVRQIVHVVHNKAQKLNWLRANLGALVSTHWHFDAVASESMT